MQWSEIATFGVQVFVQIHRESAEDTRDPSTVSIEYVTDPWCPASWAFEGVWRRLRYEYDGEVQWRLSVAPVAQGSTSWLACTAYHAARRQSPAAAELLLRRLREVRHLEERELTQGDQVLALAREVARAVPLDLARFRVDLGSRAVAGMCEEQVERAHASGIFRTPALHLELNQGGGVVLIGNRPFRAVRQLVGCMTLGVPVAPAAAEPEPPPDLHSLVTVFPRITAGEIARAWDLPLSEVETELDGAVAAGLLERVNLAPNAVGYMAVSAPLAGLHEAEVGGLGG